jgi:hypothetical protein
VAEQHDSSQASDRASELSEQSDEEESGSKKRKLKMQKEMSQLNII